jgi:hypothetical protein
MRVRIFGNDVRSSRMVAVLMPCDSSVSHADRQGANRAAAGAEDRPGGATGSAAWCLRWGAGAFRNDPLQRLKIFALVLRVVAGLADAGVCGYVYVNQRSLIFHASKKPSSERRSSNGPSAKADAAIVAQGYSEIGVMGYSLGTGPACLLAQAGRPPDTIGLLAPFARIAGAARIFIPFSPADS